MVVVVVKFSELSFPMGFIAWEKRLKFSKFCFPMGVRAWEQRLKTALDIQSHISLATSRYIVAAVPEFSSLNGRPHFL